MLWLLCSEQPGSIGLRMQVVSNGAQNNLVTLAWTCVTWLEGSLPQLPERFSTVQAACASPHTAWSIFEFTCLDWQLQATYNFPSSEIVFERLRNDWVMGIARLSIGQPQAKERLGRTLGGTRLCHLLTKAHFLFSFLPFPLTCPSRFTSQINSLFSCLWGKSCFWREPSLYSYHSQLKF